MSIIEAVGAIIALALLFGVMVFLGVVLGLFTYRWTKILAWVAWYDFNEWRKGRSK
jgi:hypothetical protein